MAQKNIKDFFFARSKASSSTEPPATTNIATTALGNTEDCTSRREKDVPASEKQCSDVPKIQVQNQPSKSFAFPQTNGRKVNHDWFNKYDWLHYDSERDSLLCYTCVRACNMTDNKSWMMKDAERSFLTAGFRSWKKATSTFATHQSSKFHKKCVEFIFNREQVVPVNAQLVEAQRKEQEVARSAMLTIIGSIRYLVRSGNAVRGHALDEGNLMMLLEERTQDNIDLRDWLARRNAYISPQIQNEIIEIMAHAVLRDRIADIQLSPWFSIIADGTTDVAAMEQFSLCVRVVDPESIEVKEIFLGMYNAPDSKGQTLTAVIKDILLRLNLPIDKLRGHCFDGAANMSGCKKGVKTLLIEEQPKSIFVHCANHSADLALQEVSRNSDELCDLLCLVKDSSNCILESSKRKTVYQNIVLPPGTDNSGSGSPGQLIALCPTRWCVRVKSLARFQQEYQRVRKTLQELVDDKGATSNERRVAIRGWLKQLEKFETALFLQISIEVFSPCEQLARSLQTPGLTATGAKEAADFVIKRLESMRTEDHFDEIFDSVERTATELDLKPPEQPRPKKIPRRLEQTTTPSNSVHLQPKDKFRKEYYEIIDILTTALKDRFDQQGLHVLSTLEDILLHALHGSVPRVDVLEKRLGIFAEDFNVPNLHTQLQLLQNLPGEASTSCAALAKKLGKESATTKALLQQVILLLVLVMTVPASAASSERSFSALRRLKTYLRSTMTQKRLTHVLILHIHQKHTAFLNLHDVLKEFVSRNEERRRIFGKV